MRKIKERFNPNTKAFWEKKYKGYIEKRELRSDGPHLDKFRPLFEKSQCILDFGAGLGGNMQHVATLVENTRFILVDHSNTSLDFAREHLLGKGDGRRNSFEFYPDLASVQEASVDLVTSIEVLEHITDYHHIMDLLWARLKPGGHLLISVPVKGIRDRNRQHVNKFTVNSMFRILSEFAEIVHIAPRTYSRRSGRLSTAYFYVQKEAGTKA
jgi:2-polyprenyl-3-methyl-5-hydroxy-6-metoxy-1,4-benzoquinol methylase